MKYRRIKLAIAFALLVQVIVVAQQNWDPPAITVFPDHDKAARSSGDLAKMVKAGRILFEARFNVLDGAGRPTATGDSKPTFRLEEGDVGFIRTSGPDANSCAGCHNQPAIGGSGDFVANVFVGAQFKDPPTSSITTDITSERNTIGMVGSGAIDMLAREMTTELLAQRNEGLARAKRNRSEYDIALTAKGVAFGVIRVRPDGTYDTSRLEGVDPDLVVKPFGAKGIAISLREFTINALNQHHGIQAVERFGWEQTGQRDFDGDGVNIEFTVGQTSALVLFQALLPAPGRSPQYVTKYGSYIRRGETLFSQIGCAQCHVPYLKLRSSVFTEPNPYNRPGNINPSDVKAQIKIPIPTRKNRGVTKDPDGNLWVWAYTDLKRHIICDEADPFFCNERLRQDNVPTDQFLTPKLWDLSTSAPYGHRGDCTTVSEVILHHSGEALIAKNNFLKISESDKRSLVWFLLSLGTSHTNNNPSN